MPYRPKHLDIAPSEIKSRIRLTHGNFQQALSGLEIRAMRTNSVSSRLDNLANQNGQSPAR